MKTTGVKIALGVTVQPKQYHSLRADVEITVELDDNEIPAIVINDVRRRELSSALQKAIIEEVEKLYGRGVGEAMLPAYGFEEKKI